jgi:hypothetical protein
VPARARDDPSFSLTRYARIEKIVRPYAAGGMLELEAVAEVAWGRPAAKS